MANTAPTVAGTTIDLLHATEGTAAAFTVGTLFNGFISDVDGAVNAIAITGLDTRIGTWQYSTDAGATWLTIRADLINSTTNELALLLGPTAQLRLLPFGHQNGAIVGGDASGRVANGMTLRAWDQSDGNVEGSYVVITATGGSTAFSADSVAGAYTVAPVNDAPSFALGSGTGKVLVPAGTRDWGQSVTLQSDGKIVVAGYSFNGTNDFSLVRLNADGTLDTTFNGTGKALVPVGGSHDYGYSVALQPDGKIVVAGFSFNGSDYDLSLIRLNANGTLDTSFNGTGKAVVPVGGSNDVGQSVTLQPDGKIVVAGSSSNVDDDFSLIRLNADGTLDTSFNGSGKAMVPVGSSNDYGQSVTVQPDGKIVVAGFSWNDNYDFCLIRLNADGTLDTSFNDTGKAIVPVGSSNDEAYSVTLQPDGKIVVAGYGWNGNYDFCLIRLNADGTLDTSFNGTGKALVPVGGSNDFGQSVTVQPDGKIVVAGYSGNPGTLDFSLIRLNADGTLDTSFNGTGKAVVPVGSSDDEAHSVTLQPDGKIVVAGFSLNGSDHDFSLIRLNADGTLDTTFNGSGIDTLGGTVSYTENAPAIALDSSVAIYDAELAALAGGAGNYAGASVTLARSGGASSQDVFSALGNLAFTAGNAVLSGTTVGTVSNAGGTLVITFNANATQARVNQVLSSIGYANSSDAPPASVQIDWTFSDGNTGSQGAGGALTATGRTTINITAVNDAPTGQDATIALTAAQTHTFSAADFGYADVDGNALHSVQIMSLPASGTLALGGVPVTAGQWIAAGTLGTLVYTPPPGNGAASASFGFVLRDDGGTANGGVDTSAQHTVTLSVSAVTQTLTGTSGSDVLMGGPGDDILAGLAGNDTLIGGPGSDTLTGGRGADRFVFDSLIGTDTITDFEGRDRIVIDTAALGALGDGDLRLEHARKISPGRPFDAHNELVILKLKTALPADLASAAALIGSAKTPYAVGQQALFVLTSGRTSEVYLFQANNADAAVTADEIQLLGVVQGHAVNAHSFVLV